MAHKISRQIGRPEILYASLISLALLVIVAGILLARGFAIEMSSITLDKGKTTADSYTLEVVSDSVSQAKGLSGRTTLIKNGGMLFKYDTVGNRCFWMKDMKFNLDIIWFNSEHRITSIVKDLSPATYPQSYCGEAQNVVEFASGVANKHNLRVGQIVQF